MANRLTIILCLSTLLIFLTSLSLCNPTPEYVEEEDDDLRYLQELEKPIVRRPFPGLPEGEDAFPEDEDEEDEEEEVEEAELFEAPSDSDNEDKVKDKDNDLIDDQDVVVLSEGNFSDVLGSNKYVMVKFHATWCGHCKAMAPEYAATAKELRGENASVVIAKIDAEQATEVAKTYNILRYPTVLFFVDGVDYLPYVGDRNKDAIISWIKKKTGRGGVCNVTTVADAKKILASEDKVVLAYLDSLEGPESEELVAASRLVDVNFYQTVDPNVAKLFKFSSDIKRPALVLLKKDAEKVTYHDGLFNKSAIKEFVFANKLPLVTFSLDISTLIYESPINKRVLLFTTSDSSMAIQTFMDAAKLFKGKLFFVHIEADNKEVGRPVAEYFSFFGDAPQVIGYTGPDNAKKFVFDKPLTFENLKAFGEDFVHDRLKAFYKSDPVPERNDDVVKIVVGKNFDHIVLDESKDVLLEIYAPWCGNCHNLEPTYTKLAKYFRDVESVVIAKMNGYTNEHPMAKVDMYPKMYFYPAGNKSSNRITVDVDKTVVSFYKFLKRHAAIPFKLHRYSKTDKKDEL